MVKEELEEKVKLIVSYESLLKYTVKDLLLELKDTKESEDLERLYEFCTMDLWATIAKIVKKNREIARGKGNSI